jgi:hypothetical protein
MKLHFVANPSFEEAAAVGRELRDQEAAPLEELNMSPADSCMEGIRNSAYVGTINTEEGDPIALVGIVDHHEEEDTGIVWSMSTNRVAEHPIAFIRAVRGLMEEYGGLYSRLISFALSDNPKHQRFHAVLGMVPTGEEVPIPDTFLTYKAYELTTTKGLNKLYYEQS